MATKPTQQPEIWASAALYASGPKVGQPTKASSEAGAAVEGHKPGPTEPTTCNEFNIFENKMSLLARWSFEGRFDKMADAHVVETDANGLLSARAADFGDQTQSGPSLTVVNSNSDWAARIATTDNDGFRLQGTHTAADGSQLALITTNQDNASQNAAVRVVCTAMPSCAGVRIQAAAAGTINGQEAMAALDVSNAGGTGLQVRTSATILPAIRAINLEDGGTTARFGHGDLEPGGANLDGTAIDCRGGDADGNSFATRGGPGIITQGGDFTTTGTPKSAGHGIVALSGQTDAAIPGGAAVFAQTTGPRGVAVEASHNSALATLPVVLATTGDNAATAYEAVVVGDGSGLIVSAQAGPGIIVVMDPDGGGDIAPAISVEVQNQPTTGPSPGHLWMQQQSGIVTLRTGIGTTVHGYVRVSKSAPCYAESAAVSVSIPTPATDFEVVPSFTWEPGMLPAATGKVRVTIWGQCRLSDNVDVDITFTVRDTSNGNAPVCVLRLAEPATLGGSIAWSPATRAQTYSLPAPGARNFDMVVTGTGDGAINSLFEGYVEIHEVGGA